MAPAPPTSSPAVPLTVRLPNSGIAAGLGSGLPRSAVTGSGVGGLSVYSTTAVVSAAAAAPFTPFSFATTVGRLHLLPATATALGSGSVAAPLLSSQAAPHPVASVAATDAIGDAARTARYSDSINAILAAQDTLNAISENVRSSPQTSATAVVAARLNTLMQSARTLLDTAASFILDGSPSEQTCIAVNEINLASRPLMVEAIIAAWRWRGIGGGSSSSSNSFSGGSSNSSSSSSNSFSGGSSSGNRSGGGFAGGSSRSSGSRLWAALLDDATLAPCVNDLLYSGAQREADAISSAQMTAVMSVTEQHLQVAFEHITDLLSPRRGPPGGARAGPQLPHPHLVCDPQFGACCIAHAARNLGLCFAEGSSLLTVPLLLSAAYSSPSRLMGSDFVFVPSPERLTPLPPLPGTASGSALSRFTNLLDPSTHPSSHGVSVSLAHLFGVSMNGYTSSGGSSGGSSSSSSSSTVASLLRWGSGGGGGAVLSSTNSEQYYLGALNCGDELLSTLRDVWFLARTHMPRANQLILAYGNSHGSKRSVGGAARFGEAGHYVATQFTNFGRGEEVHFYDSVDKLLATSPAANLAKWNVPRARHFLDADLRFVLAFSFPTQWGPERDAALAAAAASCRRYCVQALRDMGVAGVILQERGAAGGIDPAWPL